MSGRPPWPGFGQPSGSSYSPSLPPWSGSSSARYEYGGQQWMGYPSQHGMGYAGPGLPGVRPFSSPLGSHGQHPPPISSLHELKGSPSQKKAQYRAICRQVQQQQQQVLWKNKQAQLNCQQSLEQLKQYLEQLEQEQKQLEQEQKQLEQEKKQLQLQQLELQKEQEQQLEKLYKHYEPQLLKLQVYQKEQLEKTLQEEKLREEEDSGMALKVSLPSFCEVTNLRFLVRNGDEYFKSEDIGFVSFKTEQKAIDAQSNLIAYLKQGQKSDADANQDKKDQISDANQDKDQISDANQDKKDEKSDADQDKKLAKKRRYDSSLISTEEFQRKKIELETAKTLHALRVAGDGGSASKRPRKVKNWNHRSLNSAEFKWCTLQEFSLEEKLVRPFKFEAALLCSSVSPDVVLCEATNVGNLVFISILNFLFAQHIAGRTYRGNLKLQDLIISKKLMSCAIMKETFILSEPCEAQSDVMTMVQCLLPLYKVGNMLPAYYEYLVKRSTKAPNSISVEDLKKFHKEMLTECCLVPKEIRIFLAKEFNIFYKNLIGDLQKQYDQSAPTDLEDWLSITKADQLLLDIITDGIPLGKKFADEGTHIRHLVEHCPDKLDKRLGVLFPLIERDMLMFYYFKKYLPSFIELMYKERDKQEWLNKLCESYENSRLVMGIVPLEAIPHAVDFESDEEKGED